MTTTNRQRTFMLLWDGSDEGYSSKELAKHLALTNRGFSAPTRWSFGRGYGDPRAGDRVYLLRTGKDNGIVASGYLTADGVQPGPHWKEPGDTAYYVDLEWDCLVEKDDRLPYAEMKSLLTQFALPVRESGREVPSPSDGVLADAWEKRIARLSSKTGNPWLGGRPVGWLQRKSGPCEREVHVTRVYEVPAFASAQAVKEEAVLVSAYVDVLREEGHTVTGYRIQHAGPVRPLRVDLYDQTEHVLYEAKASSGREAVRMALGQLLDYRRAFDVPPGLRMLLPERPADDLVDLLAEHKVRCVYPNSDREFVID